MLSDPCLKAEKFSDLYKAILEKLEDTEIHCVFAQRTLCEFFEHRGVNEVDSGVARLSPKYTLHITIQLKENADTRMDREVPEKRIGYIFHVPLSSVPNDEWKEIEHGDFTTENTNPVISNPHTTRPIAGLANASSASPSG